jgi:hypothetical protein
MKLLITVVLFGLCSLAAALELKGIQLGAPRAAVEAQMPDQQCSHELVGYQSCSVLGVTYASKTPLQFQVAYIHGRLESYSVRLEGRFFDELRHNIEEKIGAHDPLESWQKPNSLKVIVGTEPQAVHWRTPAFRVTLLYFPPTDAPRQRAAETRIHVTSKTASGLLPAYIEAEKAQSAERVKKDM